MILRPKTSYHPHLLIAFYLNCLPVDILDTVPRSTRHDWRHKDLTSLHGYEWSAHNSALFDTLELVASNKRLLRLNKALIRIIALQRFISQYKDQLRHGALSATSVVLNNIDKISAVLSVQSILKYLNRSYGWYVKLRKKVRCSLSLLSLCRVKHPGQLLAKETDVIKTYCSDIRYQYWPLVSVYHQMIRDKTAFLSLSTFYKYTRLAGLQRIRLPHRRKNHKTGIRATAPFQILHADVTIFRTADNVKNYIHLIQDNYSRAILGYAVHPDCRAVNTFNLLNSVIQQYLIPAGITSATLLTDDGSENTGLVSRLAASPDNLSINHLIARHDIEFSNSMIEAANKKLKYDFLYHHHIPDLTALIKYIQQAIDDYNNRPHDVLNGLSPSEILRGLRFDHNAVRQNILSAARSRIAANRKMKCCHYSF